MPGKVDVLHIVAVNLLKLRNRKGYSQKKLAIICGVNYADISRIENEKINITLKTLRLLSEGLGVMDMELLIDMQK